MIAASLVSNVALLLALESGVAAPAPAPASAPRAQIVGLWKGASTCTKVEGNEFCRDETVVYNFVDVPDQPDAVALKAAKIVGRTVRRTFDLNFKYRSESGDWACEFDREASRGIWAFVIAGDGLKGTATLLPEGKVVRTVTAKRTTKDQVLAP